MVANVKFYRSTGLTPGNVLDSPAKLDSLGFSSFSVPSIAILQDRGVFKIRVNTTYSTIADVDYCKINDQCYWVTGINMLNENVAECTLEQDAYTTMGSSGFTIVSGWCTRRHVTNDALWANTIPEPFTPSEQLEIDFGSKFGGGHSNDDLQVVLAMVDISTPIDPDDPTAFTSTFYKAEAEGVLGTLGVCVPDIPELAQTTRYRLTIGGREYTAYVVNTAAFDGENSTVAIWLGLLYKLGLDSLITYAYIIPGEYATTGHPSSGLFTQLSYSEKTVASSLSPKFGAYHNNKVYSGQFQKFTLVSLTSGDSAEYEVEDIALTNTIAYKICADMRYNGYPMARPSVYYGVPNTELLGVVKGSEWASAPIKFMGSPGTMTVSSQMGILSGLIRAVGQFASQNYAGGVGSAVGTTTSNIDTRNPTVPHVKFPQADTMQNYFGNKFMDYRTRLSNGDMTRFDNFLTQFGYAVSEPLTQSCLSGRQYFNYVQAEGVDVKGTMQNHIKQGIISALQSGVRIWHTAPSLSAMTNNPIA